MKSLRWMAAVAALAFTMPAQAGVNDPEVVIYRASGVVDNNLVIATSFHCTNFSGVPETLRIVIRNGVSTILANMSFPLAHLNTIILSTHDVFAYDDISLNALNFFKGTAAIAATSVNITCTAMQVQTLDIANPVGIALHMTRFNPAPGTQE